MESSEYMYVLDRDAGSILNIIDIALRIDIQLFKA
jgi:hypothetical protein